MNRDHRAKIYGKYKFFSDSGRLKELDADTPRRFAVYDLNYKGLLPGRKESRILELGCGLGYFQRYLEKNGFLNTLGVDHSGHMLDVAEKLGAKATVKKDIFEYLRETDETFDLICSFHVFEHLFKDEILELAELIHKRLNPGGVLIIEVPNAGSPLLGSHNRYVTLTHEVGFTPTSLKEVFLVNGFEDISVFPVIAKSVYARIFFRITNYLLHSRFTKEEFMEGGLIGIGTKKD